MREVSVRSGGGGLGGIEPPLAVARKLKEAQAERRGEYSRPKLKHCLPTVIPYRPLLTPPPDKLSVERGQCKQP